MSMRGSPDGLFPQITSTLFQLRNYILGHTLTLQLSGAETKLFRTPTYWSICLMGFLKLLNSFETPCPKANMMKCSTKDGKALRRELAPGPWLSQARVPSHVINWPRHPTSGRPALITRRHALILYGRPYDRSHCLVDFNGIFTRFGACFPFALFLFLGFVQHPGFFTSPFCAIKRSN
jgi:hypothetical protein